MPELKDLRRQRGNIKSGITTFKTRLDNWRDDEANRDPDLLQQCMESLIKKFDGFEAIQDQLEQLEESEIDQRQEIEDNYNEAIARSKKYLRENAADSDARSIKSNPSSTNAEESTSAKTKVSIKLPNIPLPEFDSQIENWASFYDLFTSAIEEKNLSDAGKLVYLKSAVKGRASSLIESYPTTNANYKVALELLKSKFDFPRRAIRRHWVILREYPKIPKDTPAALGKVVELFQKHLTALESLGAPINHWDITIIDLILSKIGSYTCFQWELTLKDQDIPPYTNLLNFLEKRANSADFSSDSNATTSSSQSSHKAAGKNSKYTPYTKNTNSVLVTAKDVQKGCEVCNSKKFHILYHCSQYKNLSIPQRIDLIKKLRLCFNCLNKECPRSKDFNNQCSSEKRCQFCRRMHNTTICQTPQAETSEKANEKSVRNSYAPPNLAATVAEAPDTTSTVLLGSAEVDVEGGDGQFHTLRCIIDSAASSSFVTLTAARRIGLPFERTLAPDPVSGIGGGLVISGIQGHTTCFIKPKHSDAPLLPTETTVINKITNQLPCTRVSGKIRSHFSDLQLADKKFHMVGEVDFLLGADVFPYIYTGQKQFGPPGFPVALASIFGWVITGRIGHFPSPRSPDVVLITLPKTDELLKTFWEIEEINTPPRAHPDDIAAEEIFQKYHYRQPDGRYVVPLLLRGDAPPLGNSRAQALKRLQGILQRLERNPALRVKYAEFMNEYEKLNHMTLVPPEKSGQAKYYIPHHYVARQDAENSRFRVVFDASMKTTSGTSLNQAVYSGPKLQLDIFDFLLRFRIHQYVFTCDISKFFRQISIIPGERDYQRILWPVDGEIREFELNTVTYGVTSSPFSSQRTVKQLKEDEGHKYPLAVPVLEKGIFVDDLTVGKNSVPLLLETKMQTIKIFQEAQCELSKWGSNCKEILDEIPPQHRVNSLDLNGESSVAKILGIHWDAQPDCFFYSTKIEPHNLSKRTILSHLARLYDPLGLISPVVFKAKLIMQKLWLAGIDWDSQVPEELATEWLNLYEKLPSICSLKVDRCVTLPGAHFHSLIGFADASQSGYCCAAYIRSESASGVKVSLLAAKSRVAPTKTISIPRLELSAAKLLATLLEHVTKQLEGELDFQHVAAFTDSQVVLAWIKTIPCQLKTFEANRVSYIQDRIAPTCWKFCPGDQNPSDVGSRGCFADQLETHPLWWSGPQWLADPIESWPTFKPKPKPILISFNCNSDFWKQLISKFSTLSKLQRVTAWLIRYARNLSLEPEKRVKTSTLSVQELDQSLIQLAKVIQKKHFAQEIKVLDKGEEVPKTLKTLKPFLDSDGIIRVGGRLQNSNLPYCAKHPILLPKHDLFVNLLIDHYHEKYLHAGPRLLQSLLARQFWVLAARSIIRSRLSKCVTCFRAKPHNVAPVMADLPSARVTPSKIFLHVQLDFGGPFVLREHRRRNPKLFKAYLCLFICMATKAVHLEVASELTTEAFLAAFDRFTSRRGLCRRVLSDNATNFTGAQRHLSEVYDFLKANKNYFDEKLSVQRIEWFFIPPSGPHFGGLHEAGIKSAKYHLKRVVGEQTLTFEEMTTVFSKIEAIMNSRPLCQLSTDAAEVDVLTPGHLLTMGPLVAVPEYDWEEVPQNRLSRWQLLQKLSQQFWKIWSRDYLHTLIQRRKWQQRTENLKKGTVVIIADADSAPTHWKKGIIEELHPGRDKVVRVVTVRTATGLLRRPVVKLYPLPAQ